MGFEILAKLQSVERIAAGSAIRDIARLRRIYGRGNWRKMKAVALVRLDGGAEVEAEIHWYEANGIGRKEFKIKKIIG